MSFLFPLALLIAGLASLPILAHALRRGPLRAERFPAAHFIPKVSDVTERRGRLEDKFLLSLRVLLLCALALLGAAPLLQCSRLGIARAGGGSVALALVIDDSGSMRSAVASSTRLEIAKKSAEGLLQSTKPGDSVSLILAGAPARVLTHASSDLDGVRRLIANIEASDRSTDLFGALSLAKSSLEGLSRPSQQIVLFSDGSTNETARSASDLAFSMPVPELLAPVENCALGNARQSDGRASVELRCLSGTSLAAKKVVLYRARKESSRKLDSEGAPVATQTAKEGELVFTLPKESESELYFVRLEPGDDALPEDNEALLIPEDSSRTIGVRSDARARTGSTPVVELAFRALATNLRIKPLLSLFDRASDGEPFSALVVDDPAGFSPEVSKALESFVSDGGVLLVMFGSNISRAPLGQSFWPLLSGAPSLEKNPSPSARLNPEFQLPEAFATWTDLGAKERVIVSLPKGDRVLLRFEDGAPLLFERPLGQGLLLGTTLASSVDESDFALRPAFLALLERVLIESSRRRGSLLSLAGARWPVESGAEIEGPKGPLPHVVEEGIALVEPAMAGRYFLRNGTKAETRYVERDPLETVTPPKALATGAKNSLTEIRPVPLDISREVALTILGLGSLELGLRHFGRRKKRTSEPTSPGPRASPIESP